MAAAAEPVDTGRALIPDCTCGWDSDSVDTGVDTLGVGILMRAPSGVVVEEAVAEGDLDKELPPVVSAPLLAPAARDVDELSRFRFESC